MRAATHSNVKDGGGVDSVRQALDDVIQGAAAVVAVAPVCQECNALGVGLGPCSAAKQWR